MTPLDPAASAVRKKSDFPPKGANVPSGSADEMRCSLPRLPHVSFTPTIFPGCFLASWMTISELISMPEATPGKL